MMMLFAGKTEKGPTKISTEVDKLNKDLAVLSKKDFAVISKQKSTAPIMSVSHSHWIIIFALLSNGSELFNVANLGKLKKNVSLKLNPTNL